MSCIAILSVNHQLAPVSVREKVAFSPNELSTALKQLNKVKGIEACAILSTCNRSEIYAIVDNDNAKEILSDYLAKIHYIDRMEISPYLVYFEGL
jgi:glutamyl-tRNA reductase